MNRSRPIALAAATALLPLTALAQTVHPKGMTIFTNKADVGFTLFSPQSGGIVLIDMEGNEFHRWTLPGGSGARSQVVRPLPNGHVLAISQRRDVVELDWNSNVVWRWTLPAGFQDVHHDISRTPSGNTLVLSRQTISVESISTRPLLDDCLFEVDPAGNVVWAWETWEHYEEFGFQPQTRALIMAGGGDWAHTNSAEALPPNHHTDPAFREGNIVVSQRFTNRVFIIDRTTGRIVWTADVETWAQHNAHMIPAGRPGAGNILVFDNGAGTPYRLDSRDYSSVIEIDPVSNSVVWKYDASDSGLFPHYFWSAIGSGAQRLSNGNTLICSGVKGRLFEVTEDGTIVWEYMAPYSGTRRGGQQWWMLYRATRISSPLGVGD